LKRLKKGGVFVIAPEGTRSKTEALQQAHPGVAYFAVKTGVPIVPIAMTGTEDRTVVDNLKHFRRSHIIVRAGPAFTLPAFKGSQHTEALAEATEEIMCRIGVMLPEKYRGFYAQHPRLLALQADTPVQDS